MQNLRLLACVVAVLGSLTAAGCGGDDNNCGNGNGNNINGNGNCVPAQGALVVRNQCTVPITEIHVTTVGSTAWGPNLISGTALAPGESLTVNVACDQYDALLIDQAGEQLTIHNVNLCSSTADWVLSSNACLFVHKDP
jgi:hypothetical protein